MRNANIDFRGDEGWFVSFNLNYEDKAIRFYESFEDTHKDVYNWCVNGDLPS